MRFMIIVALALGIGGCVTPVSKIASHTISVGPSASQDVVWLLIGGRLMRCTAVQNKPSCTAVPTDGAR
jgi:hypothetical protein